MSRRVVKKRAISRGAVDEYMGAKYRVTTVVPRVIGACEQTRILNADELKDFTEVDNVECAEFVTSVVMVLE